MYSVPHSVVETNGVRALSFMRRRGVWIIVCVLLSVIAALGYSKHQTKKYTATASVLFSGSQLSQAIAGFPSTATGNGLIEQANNLELLRLGDLAQKTAATVGEGVTAEEVSKAVSIAGQPESSIASIAAVSTSPKLAAKIANAYAGQFVKEQERSDAKFYLSALALVRKQLAALKPQQQSGADGLQLQSRAQSLALLAGLQPRSVEVTEHALIPTAPSSPRTTRNLISGLLVGLFLGFGVALLLERVDQRVTTADELEALYDAPLLGVAPQSRVLAQVSRSSGDATPTFSHKDVEAFHMILARLRAVNSDQAVCTVLVTSALPGEGKTTMALHLAFAATRMGSRALLLEADLRHPALQRALNMRPEIGLPDVLRGAVSMREATRPVISHGASGPTRSLDVLLCGSRVPENPVELVEGRAMDELLTEAKSGYDLVILDAPDLTTVSDAFLLMPRVDGVIMVGHLGTVRRDVAGRVRRLLSQSSSRVLGVVANGAKVRRRDPLAASGYGSPLGSADVLATNDASEAERFIPPMKA
jgi:capsular exopolysaccharide synthesis family protein